MLPSSHTNFLNHVTVYLIECEIAIRTPPLPNSSAANPKSLQWEGRRGPWPHTRVGVTITITITIGHHWIETREFLEDNNRNNCTK